MALTTRWVTDAGSGAADGTSEANAMSFATFLDYMATGGSFTAAAGDVFQIVGNITSRGATTDTFLNGGTSTSPVVIRGVQSGGATAYAGRTNGNGPLITTSFPQITYTGTGRLNITGSFIIIENLNFTGACSNSVVTMGTDCLLLRCKVTNSSTNAAAAGVESGTRCLIMDNDISLTGASGGNFALRLAVANSTGFANRLQVTSSGASSVLSLGTASALAIHNLVIGGGGIGIAFSSGGGSGVALGNTVVGCSDGINVHSGYTQTVKILCNCITDNTGYGINLSASTVPAMLAYNRTRDNTSGAINSGTDWAAATTYSHVTTDTGGASTDYTNTATGDYSLIAASPATSAGLPSYASIGAFQRDQTSSSGGTRAYGSVS